MRLIRSRSSDDGRKTAGYFQKAAPAADVRGRVVYGKVWTAAGDNIRRSGGQDSRLACMRIRNHPMTGGTLREGGRHGARLLRIPDFGGTPERLSRMGP